MDNLYYTTPPQEAFDDMKKAAILVWHTYDDPYRSEKVDRIKDIQNVSDNFMYMFAMFDMRNQRKVVRVLSNDTRIELYDRLKAGGAGFEFLQAIALMPNR